MGIGADRSGIKATIDYLTSIGPTLRTNIKAAMKVIAAEMKRELMQKSPIGLRNGGKFQRSWDVRITDYGEGAGKGHTKIYINARNAARTKNGFIYAQFMEKGSIPGESPWPRPGKRTMKNSSGVIMSSQAPEGVATVVVPNFLPKLRAVLELAKRRTFGK